MQNLNNNMIILDGKKTSNDIKSEIAEEVKKITESGNRPPHLAAVIVGNDGAIICWSKVKACEKVGYESTLIKLLDETTEDELLNQVEELNKNDFIDGYIVRYLQHIDTQTILMAVDPDKDVDGFHPTNFGKMSLNLPTFFQFPLEL